MATIGLGCDVRLQRRDLFYGLLQPGFGQRRNGHAFDVRGQEHLGECVQDPAPLEEEAAELEIERDSAREQIATLAAGYAKDDAQAMEEMRGGLSFREALAKFAKI